MKRFRVLACVLGILSWAWMLPGCAGAVSNRGAEAAVREADLALARAVAQSDRTAFADLIAEDAVFFSGAISRGRAAVVRAWEPLIDPERKATLSWSPTRVHVAESGDLAYTIGDFELRTTTESGKSDVRVGSYVTVWKRGSDGRWRAVADSGSPPQPRQP